MDNQQEQNRGINLKHNRSHLDLKDKKCLSKSAGKKFKNLARNRNFYKEQSKTHQATPR